MTPVEVLRGARELLADPRRWTKRWFAKSIGGSDIDAMSPSAVCWCVAGGIERVAGGRGGAYCSAIRTFVEANDVELPRSTEDDEERDYLQDMLDSIGGFNDEREHSDVLAALDRAIASAEAKCSTPAP